MHNRRRSARRKLWEITSYKDSEQHISDSDNEKEEKASTKYKKKSCIQQFEKNTLEDWISCASGFECREGFERKDKIHDTEVHSSEDEALIETTSCSDDDNLQSTQLSISEISCSSKKSYLCTKQCDYQDFQDDSSEYFSPTIISDIAENSHVNFPNNQQERNIPYTISPPSSPIDSANSNAKGSEWLLTIPWQPRSHKDVCLENELDSGKKKKKYTNGGFADHLHKLQSREKSAKAFWDHHSCSKSPLYEKGSMILELTEATCSYGTVTCKAIVLKPHHLNELDLLHNSASCTNNDINLNANDVANEEVYENYIVLFDYDQYEELNVSAGSIVQLFPPWKVLQVENLTAPVLLCTHFLQVVKKTDLLLTRKYQKQDGEIT